ncbi:MAG: hypothetical protein OEM32_01700 [Acidimicrobiia bacterium]|nr:hypothetical protein [Acidimicrobiia bacterium]
MGLGNGYRLMDWGVAMGRAVAALLRRPVLLWEAFRAGLAVRAHGRLRPSAQYLHWRVHTAYGNHMSETTADDLIQFLKWRRQMRRIR